MKSFISSLLSFLALMLFASTDNDSIDQHFNEKNKKTVALGRFSGESGISAQAFECGCEDRTFSVVSVFRTFFSESASDARFNSGASAGNSGPVVDFLEKRVIVIGKLPSVGAF